MVFLLVIIYITFISLGLPDSLFGVAWPVVHIELGVPESMASIFMIIVALSTGGVSFVAGKLIRKFGTGNVTFVSVLLTVIGLIGFSFSTKLWMMIVSNIVLGLGAGAIDTGLNNFVSLHYKASHMNWLHCFWGLGVTISPIIMSYFIDNGGWRDGYRVIAVIQAGIFLIIAFSLPKWKQVEKKKSVDKDVNIHSAVNKEITKQDDNTNVVDNASAESENIQSVVNDSQIDKNDNLHNTIVDNISAENESVDNKPLSAISTEPIKKEKVRVFRIKGVIFAIIALGIYSGMEVLLGTWGASFLVNARSLSPATASLWISLYYGGIMLGRLVSGFVSYKVGDKWLIRGGIVISVLGMVILAIPIGVVSLVGLLLIGFGFAPIFPSFLHAVPDRFGIEYSADVTGYQMGGAYAIGFVFQLAFGYTATATTFEIAPYVLLGMSVLLFVFSEITNKKTKKIK